MNRARDGWLRVRLPCLADHLTRESEFLGTKRNRVRVTGRHIGVDLSRLKTITGDRAERIDCKVQGVQIEDKTIRTQSP